MKSAFYVLAVMNIVMLVWQWSAYRDSVRIERYQANPEVLELVFVNNDFQRESGSCTLLGPFRQQSEADVRIALLNKEGFEVGLIDQVLDRAPAYWVYFSDFENGVGVREQFNRFQSEGIDSFIIREGELKGNISLGVFRNIDSARRMQELMSNRGYKVQLFEIERHENEFWIQIKALYTAENKREIRRILGLQYRVSEMRQFFCK